MRKICAEKNRVTSCDISPAQNLKKWIFFVTLRQNENIKIFPNFPTSIFEIVHFIAERRRYNNIVIVAIIGRELRLSTVGFNLKKNTAKYLHSQ